MAERRHPAAGFTLTEMMVTIAVLSTLLLAALPRFGDFQRGMSMQWTARNLATNVRLGQQRAAAANRRVYMDFDVSRGFITLWVDQDLDRRFDGVSEVRAVGFVSEDKLRGLPGIALPKGTSFESVTFPKGIRSLPSISFAPDGSVAAPGEVVLKDGKRRYKVEVSLAGGVSILQEVGGKWVE